MAISGAGSGRRETVLRVVSSSMDVYWVIKCVCFGKNFIKYNESKFMVIISIYLVYIIITTVTLFEGFNGN